MPSKKAAADAAGASVIRNTEIALFSVRDHPRNYNRHSGEQLEKLRASLRRFGQVRSVVVQDDGAGGYVMVAGHGIKEAARLEQYLTLKADIIPADWTPAQVEGYLVSDNLTAKQSTADDTMLAAILQEQANMAFDLASLGSSQDELEALLATLADSVLADGDPFAAPSPAALLPSATPGAPARQNSLVGDDEDDGPDMPPEYEVVMRGDGESGATPDDRLLQYNSTILRQIMLVMTQDVYAVLLQKLSRIAEAEGLETNTEVVQCLVDYYADAEGLDNWPDWPAGSGVGAPDDEDAPDEQDDEDDDDADEDTVDPAKEPR